MSGGVDSSVTAALLLERGFEVIGITMRLGLHDVDSHNSVSGSDAAVNDARHVAKQLGIPFHEVDFGELFKREIVDYFYAEYSAGRTPNPCVMCNRKIKFGALLKRARELGASHIATGHYARISRGQHDGRYILRCGIDHKKDQSYALFLLAQDQLKHIMMPLGEYAKQEVREIARKMSLKAAKRPVFPEDRRAADMAREALDALGPGK